MLKLGALHRVEPKMLKAEKNPKNLSQNGGFYEKKYIARAIVGGFQEIFNFLEFLHQNKTMSSLMARWARFLQKVVDFPNFLIEIYCKYKNLEEILSKNCIFPLKCGLSAPRSGSFKNSPNL